MVGRFWDFIGRVFLLQSDVFQEVNAAGDGWILALGVVFGAGLSIAISEGIILFINRVKPLRFCLTLLISTILFAFGYVLLVLSTWLIDFLPGTTPVSLLVLIKVFGISFAPLLFSFLGALPYFGILLLNFLSIWHLLAMVVGFAAVKGVSLGTAFSYVSLGWLILQILQRTLGQPIARLGQKLLDRAAGVAIVQEPAATRQFIQNRLSSSIASESPPSIQPPGDRSIPVSPPFSLRPNPRTKPFLSPPSSESGGFSCSQLSSSSFSLLCELGCSILTHPYRELCASGSIWCGSVWWRWRWQDSSRP